MLLTEEFSRLSIDLDIVVNPGVNLIPIFEAITQVDRHRFTGYEEDIRNRPETQPFRHYKFYFNSVNPTQRNSYVLLDVLYEEPLHAEYVSKNIQCSAILTENPMIPVTMPTVDALLGDKLTAFAPTTTGILFGSNKEMEICKQLFDIATLFNHHTSTRIVEHTFNRIALTEAGYRKLHHLSPKDVLIDALRTSIIIGARGRLDPERFDELERGRRRAGAYVLGQSYTFPRFLRDASKVAYLSASLLKNKVASSRWTTEEEVLTTTSDRRFSFINKLRKISPEAYYYFNRAVDSLEEDQSIISEIFRL